MVNYISEILPVPVKHFCDPDIAKSSTHMITFTKKNLYGKCIPCFFLHNDDGRIFLLNVLAG